MDNDAHDAHYVFVILSFVTDTEAEPTSEVMKRHSSE